MMTVVVWSRNECPYCDQAKALLKSKGISYEERNISTEWTKEQLLESVPAARSVPQIVIDGNIIGGFNELRKHLAG